MAAGMISVARCDLPNKPLHLTPGLAPSGRSAGAGERRR